MHQGGSGSWNSVWKKIRLIDPSLPAPTRRLIRKTLDEEILGILENGGVEPYRKLGSLSNCLYQVLSNILVSGPLYTFKNFNDLKVFIYAGYVYQYLSYYKLQLKKVKKKTNTKT